MELPPGPWDVVYADPPWRLGPPSPTRKSDPAFHYETMSYDALREMDVASILAEDATLYMWVTNWALAQGLQVMRAWGCEYKSNLVWVKLPAAGPGNHLQHHHELLLIGTRGRPGLPPKTRRMKSVYTSPRRRHSEKPAEIRTMIRAAWPDARCVELFARHAEPGWAAWGKQAPSDPPLRLFAL